MGKVEDEEKDERLRVLTYGTLPEKERRLEKIIRERIPLRRKETSFLCTAFCVLLDQVVVKDHTGLVFAYDVDTFWDHFEEPQEQKKGD